MLKYNKPEIYEASKLKRNNC